MAQDIQSPFSGYPVTKRGIDDQGLSSFEVAPLALTPRRAKLADLVSKFGAFGLTAEGALFLSTQDQASGWLWAGMIAGPWFVYPLIRASVRALFAKRVRIRITRDLISVRRWIGWKNFDRRLPHKFTLLAHDKTKDEKLKHSVKVQRAQRAGKMVLPAVYYGESFHLSFEYLGQRNDLLTVFERKKALAILARLKACDEVVDAELKRGQGTPLEPEDEWGEQPGDIPESD